MYMFTKRLATLALIHSIDELLSPFVRKTKLFEGHMNSIVERSDASFSS